MLARSVLLGVLLAILVAPPAIAGSDAERAELFFDAGNIAYRKGRYAEAVQSFEEAYRLLPQPEIAFSLAQALRRQFAADGARATGRRAIALYREYLDRAPEGRRRPEAVEHIETLSRTIAFSETSTRARASLEQRTQLMLFSEIDGARASVDGGPPEPLTRLVNVEPGRRSIEASASGYRTARFEVFAIEGQKTAVKVELEEKPGSIRIDAPDDASIYVDGAEVGRAPLRDPLPLSPGTHRIVVSAAGHVPFVDTVALQRDREALVQVELDRTTQRNIALGTLGATGLTFIGAVIATALSLRWQARATSIDRMRTMENVPPELILELNENIERRNLGRSLAIGAWISSVVLGGLSAVLMLTDHQLPSPERAVH